jgi:membrane protein implicated in regulation of membrane protease activity
MVSTGFYLAPFSLAAFVAAGADAIGAPGVVSLVVFLVCAGLLFGFVRPVARRHTRMPPLARTNTDALIGQRAVVLERIANDEGAGLVKIGGETWTARTLDDSAEIAQGTPVVVVEIRGATALVSEY